jgi:N-acetyl-anhydromuramyl-L-alanine amidase AmpD
MKLVDLRTQLANYETYKNWRRPANSPINGIVIHHTGTGTVNADGSPRLQPKEMARIHVENEGRAHVSYHYAVARDGTVSYLLDEEIAGYHLFLAVPSRKNNPTAWQRWNGEFKGGQYFNFHTISIVLLGWFDSNRNQGGQVIPDNQNSPSTEQLNATLELVRDIQKRHTIPTHKVEGHSEILARTGFGTTTCPGTLFSMSKFREAISQGRIGGGDTVPTDETVGNNAVAVPKGPVKVPDPAPPLRLNFRNRPLVGLHARNDSVFTPTDWAIIRNAKIESLKMMSQTQDSVYEEARRIDPKMEFIVRLFSGRNGKGNELPPDEFVNFFRDTINRLHQKFGVLKFEIHNEPNHLTGHEGWGQFQEDALNFQAWYKRVFAGLRANHPWALLGYPGLAVPHNDLQWLEWNREAIEMSDWLGVHPYWQTPPHARQTFKSQDWGQRYLQYHAKYPHKLLEITEFGNSNGQGDPPIPFSREEQRDQYVEWFGAIMDQPYLGSAHSFLATSPDPVWVNQGFAWGDANGPFPVAGAVGNLARPKRAPDWYYAFKATVPTQLGAGIELSFPATLGNGGRLPWLKSGAARSAISAKWVRVGADGKEELIEDGRQWLELPHDMVSGDMITFRMKIITPTVPASYKLRLAVFHHGHQKWLHDLEEITEPDYFSTRIVAVQPAPAPTPPPPPPPPVPTPPTPPVPTPQTGKYGVLYIVTLPQTLTIGEKSTLSVNLTNSGTRPWSARGTNPVVVVPQWLTLQGQPVDISLRTPLPKDVLPQEKITVNVPIMAPSAPGTYFFRLDMAEEGKVFFSQQGSSPLRRQIEIKGVATLKEVDAEWLEVRVPAQLAVNGEGRADVRLRNRGTAPWDLNSVRVAYHWGDNTPVRVQLPTMVATGQEVALGVPLKAPATAGLKTIVFDLWREGKGWLMVPPPVQRVTITESPTRDLDEAFITGQTKKTTDHPVPTDTPPFNIQSDHGEMQSSLPTVPDLPDEGIEGSGGFDLPSAIATTPALVETGTTPNPHSAVVAVMVSENTADVRLAIDGDPMTAWRTSGKQQGGEWIQVDFGEERSIRTIKVENLPEEFPRGYRLEGSTDGESWAVLTTAPENHASVDVTLPQSVTIRYLKLTQTNRNPFQHWSVVEVVVAP